MSLSLSAFQSGMIYLDTMVLYTFLRVEDRIRPIIGSFFERIEMGAIAAYTSVLTFDELSYRLLLALIKDKYAGSPLDRLRAEEENMLREFAPLIIPKLQALQQFPHLYILDVTEGDLQTMLQNMLDYPLRPRDALHLAAMQKIGCWNLASNDAHFDAVPQVRRFVIEPP